MFRQGSKAVRYLAGILAFFFTFCPVIAAPLTGSGGTTPAEQSELSQSGRSLKQDVFSPVKGLATNVSDMLRDGDYAKVLNNLHQFVRGVWTSRGAGWTKQRANTFNSGGSILELAQMTNADGTSTFLLQSGGKIYKYNLDTTTETQIHTGVSTSAVPSLATVFYSPSNTVYIYGTNGTDNQWYWSVGAGSVSTFSLGTVLGRTWGAPKYVANHQGRIVEAGFTAFPNTVLIWNTSQSVAVSDPLAATDAGYIDLSSELGAITGIRSVRLDDDTSVLLVGCSRGMAMITGSDALDYRGVELTRDFGLPSNRTWVDVLDSLYFQSTDGIRAFYRSDGISGSRFEKVSGHIQDIFNRVNTTYSSKSFAVHNPAKQEVVFWTPIDSDTSPAHAVVMSYNTPTGQASAKPEVVFSTMDGIAPVSAINYNGTVYYGRSDGYLMTGYSGNDWDGTAINWDYVSPLIGAGSPSQNASNRKFLIMTEGGDQSFTAEAYTLQSMSDGKQKFIAQDTRTLSQTAASVTNLGTWQASSTTTTYPKLFDFESRGSGRYWTLRLRGTTSGAHIDLVGVQSILTVGGFKQ